MYFLESDNSRKRIHTDQPGFIIPIIYEWLVIFISSFYFPEHTFLRFVKRSLFSDLLIHTHRPVFLNYNSYIFKFRRQIR